MKVKILLLTEKRLDMARIAHDFSFEGKKHPDMGVRKDT
jgi:hypothetical protein